MKPWRWFKAKADALMGFVNWLKSLYQFGVDNWKLVVPIVALLGGGATVGTVAAVEAFSDPVPNIAPGEYGVTIFDDEGVRLNDPRIVKQEESGSLILFIAPDFIIDTVVIDGATFGPPDAGVANVMQIYADTGFHLDVENVLIDGLHCAELSIQDNEIYRLVLQNNKADGSSVTPTIGGTEDVEVPVTAVAGTVASVGSTYDLFTIKAMGNIKIKTLTLTNVDANGGVCVIQNIHAGTFTIQNSFIGRGDGFSLKDFKVLVTNTVTHPSDGGTLDVALDEQ
tara:strand:- start:296 stop:1141 length:846 start_codon:yes stop_codon:yes gene_type:complete